MINVEILLYGSLALLGLTLFRRYRNLGTQLKAQHPPSPRSLPFIGNLFSIPAGAEHKAYIELGSQLNSDIIFLKMLGQNILVLNSARTASDLLEKRSALYSDRFCPPMVKDPSLMDWSMNLALLGYSDLWRHHRRMLNNWLNSRAVAQFHGQQEHQSQLLLKRLLEASDEPQPFDHVKKAIYFTMGASMLQLAYGYRPKNSHDRFFNNARRVAGMVSTAVMPTNFLVNVFPALTYIPDWLPGTNWKSIARAWREEKERTVDEPYEWTKGQVDAGKFEPSILSALLQGSNLTSGLSHEERDARLKELGITLYLAGTDTTSNTLVSFVAAMVLNPHVQDKAQKEINEILGPTALPTLADRDRLPYIRNLIMEVLRWRPVLPLGIPHTCFQDDVYQEYQIQKGTVVMGNIWAMSRDKRVYEDVETFNPDRYLDPSVPAVPVFGWGRRKCPGSYFAEASLFLAVTSLLAAFRFSKKKDAQGNDIIPRIQDTPNALVLELEPFEFEFQPRSERHRQMILEAV